MSPFKWEFHLCFKPLCVFSILIFLICPAAAQHANDSLDVRTMADYNLPELKPAELNDPWLGADKARHFAGSLISTVFLGKLSQEQFGYTAPQGKVFGAGITFALGLGKEINDSRNPGNIFSVKDLVADIAGIAAGILILGVN